MKKIYLIALFLFLLNPIKSNAQVWYPEGVYYGPDPVAITVDNQVITIGRSYVDATNSYWIVSVSDGKTWNRLPVLVLNKAAEITDIKKFKGLYFVAGNFTFDGTKFSSLVKFDGTLWQGLAQFKKFNQTVGAITSLQTFNNQLVIGGSFQLINADTIPFLASFNYIKFSKYFDCRNCEPNNVVNDLDANDSVLAICGTYSSINGIRGRYITRVKNGKIDTFPGTNRIIDRVTLKGEILYACGGAIKDKRIYQSNSNNTLTDIKFNLDTNYFITDLLVFENKLVIGGGFSMVGASTIKLRVARLDGNVWTEITNNFKGISKIATGRGLLFGIGVSPVPISIWNPNRNVMRFYPGAALVKANVFLDSNNNCIREKNEKPAPKQYIKLAFLNKGVFTNEHGLTEFLVPNATSNTFRFVVKPFRNYIKSNCADTVLNKTFNPGQYMDSIQFPLNLIPNLKDIKVGISSPKGKYVQKDKKVVYYINYENVGSTAITGKINLRKSKYFSSDISLPAHTVIDDSTVQWTFTNLNPGESKIIAYSALPSGTQFNNIFQFEASVTSSISNGSTSYNGDDYDSIPQEVSGGLNAFHKDVFPTPLLGDSVTYLAATDRDLRYNISFNNFSTDTVFYAIVIDTLDINLDMAYIQETGSNKAYYTEVQSDPNNPYRGIIIWHFPNINLYPNPTKNYENMNSGSYIGFKVITKPLSKGYYLKNSASVFYDNNYAGSTNAVYCTLKLTSIDDVDQLNEQFKIYPNPSNDIVNLDYEFSKGDCISIYNMNGQLVQQHITSETNSINLNLSDLPKGVYVINLMSDGKLLSKKIVKE